MRMTHFRLIMAHQGRRVLWRRTPIQVGAISHLQNKSGAVLNIRMAERRFIQRFSVQLRRLDVFIAGRNLIGNDCKLLAAA